MKQFIFFSEFALLMDVSIKKIIIHTHKKKKIGNKRILTPLIGRAPKRKTPLRWINIAFKPLYKAKL
ncbi:MAG: hypothetical protein B7Y39_04900 [Bdellovibrio sp. 28-41-41]|nr:MAG: hypothetical protein B7Y39_04900 [Bdellovibrio sp. 28-41-41]